jgi:hypothetical protein
MEYAVRAETKEGDLVTLKRGFPSLSDAEDYPVRLYLWRRVWVEPAAKITGDLKDAARDATDND